MKQHPILFSTPMVQAILEGRKTMTRRIIKPQPSKQWAVETYCKEGPGSVDASDLTAADIEMDDLMEECKYGKPGDILWVREALAVTHSTGPSRKRTVWYKADNLEIPPNVKFKWKPSIHMMRGDCRLYLEITGIRVERLLDISEADAVAEGVQENVCDDPTKCISSLCKDGCSGKGEYYRYPVDFDSEPCYSATESFQSLWESINGPESWTANPWVWVIEFKKTAKP